MSNLDLNVLPEGTVISSGTLRTQDLLRAMSGAWERCINYACARNIHAACSAADEQRAHNAELADLVDQQRAVVRGEVYPVLKMYGWLEDDSPLASLVNEPELHEFASSLLEDVCAALQQFAPDGCYVGMHEGDGSLLGVWRAEDGLFFDCTLKDIDDMYVPVPRED